MARTEGGWISTHHRIQELKRVSQNTWPDPLGQRSGVTAQKKMCDWKAGVLPLVLYSLSPLYHLIISIHKAHTPLALDFGVIHSN